jgi:hypothetical protein
MIGQSVLPLSTLRCLAAIHCTAANANDIYLRRVIRFLGDPAPVTNPLIITTEVLKPEQTLGGIIKLKTA